MITAFEGVTGRTLYPAQVEQLLINLYAYRETLIRNAIQNAGVQNLLAFAEYPMIDYLGAFLDTPRLPPQPATTTIAITLVGVQGTQTVIAAGYQVGTTDGAFIFATKQDLVIPAGGLSGTVPAVCLSTGTGGNGYIPGQISVPLTTNVLVATATNASTSANGADAEKTDHYRTRIQAAPNELTTGGPAGSYRALALGVSTTIVDVQVPQVPAVPGTVDVYLLTGPVSQPHAAPNNDGIASGTLISAVQNALSSQTVRPLCDTVIVHPVVEVDYAVTGAIILYGNVNFAAVNAGITAAAQNMALKLAANIQQDIVTSQWNAVLSVLGVYDADITITANIGGVPLVPTADGTFSLAKGQWANCTAVNLTVVLGAKNQPTS